MTVTAVIFIGLLYLYGFQLKTLAYMILFPMLLCAFVIDYRLKIIPNRLNLTIFEVGLVYTFLEGIININIAIDMLLGMIAGAGIFLFITLVGGLIAGKEAMGFGDVKLMGGTRIILWMENHNNYFSYSILTRSNSWNYTNVKEEEEKR